MATNLRVPGPTPCPEEVLEASGLPMINHRGPEFRDLVFRLTKDLQDIFMTKNDLYILSASGTGALEAAIVNTMSPGDKVLGVSIGIFGDRFVQIAKAYGADIEAINAPHGKAIDPAEIRKALDANPSIKTVLVTHNETSTGVTNDIASIAKVVKEEFGKLLLVDATSSVSSIPCKVDDWDLDVVTSGSQKGWMAPPGLAFVSVSKRAWEAQTNAKMPRFYFDFSAAKRSLERGQTPWTPAVSVYYAMDVALQLIKNEGIENVFARHAKIAEMCRKGINTLGLQLFADESVASNTVTAVRVPEGVNASQLIGILRTEYDVVLAGGQSSLEGKIFRIGHLGYCSEQEIQSVLESLESALPKVGFQPTGTVTRSG